MNKQIDITCCQQYLLDLKNRGILNDSTFDLIQQDMLIQDKEAFVKEKHPYEIWQGSDGFWRTYIWNEEKKARKLLNRKEYTKLIEFLSTYYQYQAMTFEKVFTEWLNQKLSFGEIVKGSYDRYLADYKRFFAGTSFEKQPIKCLTEKDLDIFIREAIHDMELSSKSYAGLRTLLLGVFKYAKKEGYTQLSISSFFSDLALSKRIFKKADKGKKRVFTKDEIGRIEAFTKQDKECNRVTNLAIMFAFECGLRPGELVSIKWSDILWQEHKLIVRRQEIRFKKDDKYHHEVVEYTKTEAGERFVILTDKALEYLKMVKEFVPEGSEFVFMKNGKRITEQMLTNKLYRICDSLGIERRSMNKARKTYASRLINSKMVDDAVVTQMMGHRQITTTFQYYYDNDKDDEVVAEQVRRALG